MAEFIQVGCPSTPMPTSLVARRHLFLVSWALAWRRQTAGSSPIFSRITVAPLPLWCGHARESWPPAPHLPPPSWAGLGRVAACACHGPCRAGMGQPTGYASAWPRAQTGRADGSPGSHHRTASTGTQSGRPRCGFASGPELSVSRATCQTRAPKPARHSPRRLSAPRSLAAPWTRPRNRRAEGGALGDSDIAPSSLTASPLGWPVHATHQPTAGPRPLGRRHGTVSTPTATAGRIAASTGHAGSTGCLDATPAIARRLASPNTTGGTLPGSDHPGIGRRPGVVR